VEPAEGEKRLQNSNHTPQSGVGERSNGGGILERERESKR
jgi:hypothetical protein